MKPSKIGFCLDIPIFHHGERLEYAVYTIFEKRHEEPRGAEIAIFLFIIMMWGKIVDY